MVINLVAGQLAYAEWYDIFDTFRTPGFSRTTVNPVLYLKLPKGLIVLARIRLLDLRNLQRTNTMMSPVADGTKLQ